MSIEGRDLIVSLSVQNGAVLVAGVRKAAYVAPFPCAIVACQAVALDAPAAASIILDVNLATLSSSAFSTETTLFTTQANRPLIAAAKNIGTLAVPDVVTLAKGDVVTVDVDQTGTAPTNEVQLLTPASSGDTTTTFDGESTGAVTIVAADATGAALLQTSLLAMSNLNTGDVTVAAGSGGTAGKLVVTFAGSRAGTDVPQLGVSGTGTAISTATGGDPGDPGSLVALYVHLERI